MDGRLTAAKIAALLHKTILQICHDAFLETEVIITGNIKFQSSQADAISFSLQEQIRANEGGKGVMVLLQKCTDTSIGDSAPSTVWLQKTVPVESTEKNCTSDGNIMSDTCKKSHNNDTILLNTIHLDKQSGQGESTGHKVGHDQSDEACQEKQGQTPEQTAANGQDEIPKKKRPRRNRWYVCEKCGTEFNRVTHLYRHKKEHLGKKQHVCNVCSDKFDDKSSLKLHRSKHVGDKPYLCKYCDNTFRTKYNRDRHTLIHTGEKPHVCGFCGRGFTQKNDQKNHEKIHTGEKPHVCPVCFKDFINKKDLKRHKRVHTGEKPFACSICNKPFSDKGNLHKHTKTVHASEKLYSCRKCGKSFGHPTSLKKHEMNDRIHGVEIPQGNLISLPPEHVQEPPPPPPPPTQPQPPPQSLPQTHPHHQPHPQALTNLLNQPMRTDVIMPGSAPCMGEQVQQQFQFQNCLYQFPSPWRNAGQNMSNSGHNPESF